MLDTDPSSDEDEIDLLKAAKTYLDTEAQEKIETTIEDSKKVEIVESRDCWNQAFFKPGNKVSKLKRVVYLRTCHLFHFLLYRVLENLL